MRNQVSTLFNGISNYITGFAKQYGINWRENNGEMNNDSEDFRKTMGFWDMIVNSHKAGVRAASSPLNTNTATEGRSKKEVTDKKDRNNPSKKLNGGPFLYEKGSKIKTYKEPNSGIQFISTSDIEEKRKAAKESNDAYREKAKSAIEGGHVIPAAYYLYKSIPWLGGENEYYNPYMVTGTAPTPVIGKVAKGANVVSKVSKAGKVGKASKAAKDPYEGMTVGEYLDYIQKERQAAEAAQEAQKVKTSMFSEDAKKLYNSLTEAEKRNFDVFLKNGNSSLDTITAAEYGELVRLSKGQFSSSPSLLTPFSNTTNAGGTSLVFPGFNLTQMSKWQY